LPASRSLTPNICDGSSLPLGRTACAFAWRSGKSFRIQAPAFAGCAFGLGDSLRRLWETGFVTAVPPAGVRPLTRFPLMLAIRFAPRLDTEIYKGTPLRRNMLPENPAKRAGWR